MLLLKVTMRKFQAHMTLSRTRFPLRYSVLAVLVALMSGGCTTGLGPRAIRSERPSYNQQIVRSGDEQMLLNLVRLRYNDSPQFLELGTVVVQYNYNASLSASGQITPNPGLDQANLGTGLAYSEQPTLTYTPLMGEDFAERMLTPIPLDSLMLFSQTGWSDSRLLLVAVQRINNVFNAPTATGPTPARKPAFEDFHEMVELLRHAQLAGLIGMNWEEQGSEKQPPGRNPRFWVHTPADTNSPLAAEIRRLRRLLDLEPGREDFTLTAFPFERQPSEVGIRCRSLLGVLYFLAESVELPPPHAEAGLATITRDADGRPFDWAKVTSPVMTIHSRKDHPANAAVAVKYRGWWFYIADDDQNSKATFSLLNILFSLQSASAKGKSPVLTLPVGK